MNMAGRSQIRLALTRPAFELQLDIELPATGITVLYGASGSGKTTVLRCVGGLERASEGLVRIGSDVWQDDQAGVFWPTWRRAVGYVFQEASLFEHMTVKGNLNFGLKRTRSAEGAHVLNSAIGMLGIENLLERAPTQLSGGERQRVAIARALATEPRLLLLDEPLAALDQARKREIMPWLERMRDELSVPMLYVTHSADELARLADHVVVLDRGRVKAHGPAAAALASVDNAVLAGDEVGGLLSGHVAERDARWHLARVAFEGGSLWLRDSGLPIGHAVRLRVLARDVGIATAELHDTSIQNQVPCTIESSVTDLHPSQVLVQVSVGPCKLLARITGRSFHALGLHPGQRAWLQIKSVALLQ